MPLSDWLSLVAVSIMGATFPGASLAVVLRHTVNNSRLHGVVAAVVHGLTVGFYALLSVLGLMLVLKQSPQLFTAISYAGALYLLWIGYQSITAKPGGRGHATPDQQAVSLGGAARDGLMIALLNPKIGLFFLALFSQFIQPGMGLAAKAIFVSTITVIDGGWYVLVATVLSQGKVLAWLKQHQVWVERVLGVILILLALRIFLQ